MGGRVVAESTLARSGGRSPFPVIPVTKVRDLIMTPCSIVIAVFGWGPIKGSEREGWTPLPPMEQRIDAAEELATAYPEAQIIASGGAVTSGKVEGVFIREELMRRNSSLGSRIVVDPSARDSEGNALFIGKYVQEHVNGEAILLIIGSDWQDPRF